MGQYLDKQGVAYLWSKISEANANADATLKTELTNAYVAADSALKSSLSKTLTVKAGDGGATSIGSFQATSDKTLTIPTASSSSYGVVKTGFTTSGKNYGVNVDSTGKMYVNVPWTDNNTIYSAGTGISIGSGNKINHTNSIAEGTASGGSGTKDFGGSFTIPSVTFDAQGHIKSYSTTTVTLPSSTASTSAAGLMSTSDKSKLEGIASGAQVNQNAFSNVKVGDTTVSADSTTDTLTLVAGSNITLTPDATNDKITIASANTVYSAGTGIAFNGTTINHKNSVTAGSAIGGSGTKDFGGSFTIPAISYDAQGHITSYALTTVTLPQKPTTISGNAGSASQLQTARNINGTSFNGTADITTAKWGTARILTIGNKGQSVDGSGNVSWSLSDIGAAPLASPALTGTPTAPTATAGTKTTQIATTEFVMNAFTANDAMVFKGTIGSTGATVTALPASHSQGWTYRVATAGTYAGQACEVGDMIICVTDGSASKDSDWTVVQTNIDGAVTGPSSSYDAHVATFNGTSGKIIKDSGFTIGTSVPSGAVFTDTKYYSGNGITVGSGNKINHSNSAITAGTVSGSGSSSFGGTVTIPKVTYDAYGHITGTGTTSFTLPSADATTSAHGLMSTSDKSKLDGIASGAEVNQNTFSKVTVGTTTIEADAKQDTLTLVAGSNITLTPDTTYDKVTITAVDTKYTQGTGISLNGTTINHSNSITAGTAKSTTTSVGFGGSFTIPSVTFDGQGHITGTGTTSVTIPSNPNSHYTTTLYAGNKTKANVATTNGNTYLGLFDDSTNRSNILVKGTNSVSVSSDANGIVTVDSPNLSLSSSGSGNAVTAVSVSGHTVTVTKGTTFPTTDTKVTTVSVGGSGNAVTTGSISSDGKTLTLTKGTTFLTSQKTSKNIVGTSTTATSNGQATNPYLNHLEDSTVTSTHQIKGGGYTSVSSDASGNITISSSVPSLSKGTTSGSGNAVTDISVSGHTITLTKGATFTNDSALTQTQILEAINNPISSF